MLALFAGARAVASDALPLTPNPLMQWADLLARPRPVATQRIAYGTDPAQIADLWLPDGVAHPSVVVMIHGGCWQAHIANLSIMDFAASDLAARGLAVWNIEYRGIDQPGGGYPGTYHDVEAAIARLGPEAAARGLDLTRVVIVGHSAGGHLALWAAKGPAPQGAPYTAVVDLAGIANLETDTDTACGAGPTRAMTGEATSQRPDVFRDTSPAHRLPLGVPTFVIHGADDVTVAPPIGAAYAARARAAGDAVEVLTPPGGHVEEIAPGSEAWEATIAPLIVKLARG